MIRLAALFIAIGLALGLQGCGGGSGETCLESHLRYSGSAQGHAYLRVVSTADNGASYAALTFSDSMPHLVSLMQQLHDCYGSSNKPPLAISAWAWIDVSNTAEQKCVSVLSEGCLPGADEPQGQARGTLRDGEVSTIEIEVRDPAQ